jgi:hypothetical protein
LRLLQLSICFVSSFLLNHCPGCSSQCNGYQIQYPAEREAATVPAAGGTARVLSKTNTTQKSLVGNFYSSSLCRKNNTSHLKKQRGPTVAAIAAASSSSHGAAVSAAAASASAASARSALAAREPTESGSSGNTSPVDQDAAALAPEAAESRERSPLSVVDLLTASISSHVVSIFSAAAPAPAAPAPATNPQCSLTFVAANGFRGRLALRLLANHQFAAFRDYLKKFPLVCLFCSRISF